MIFRMRNIYSDEVRKVEGSTPAEAMAKLVKLVPIETEDRYNELWQWRMGGFEGPRGDLLAKIDFPIPVVPQLNQKTLERVLAKPENFDMGSWHGLDRNDPEFGPTCDTSHCIAGWFVHLAGETGYDLEKLVGPEEAGRMIFLASCPDQTEYPDFYATKEMALHDLKDRAELEKANP